MRAGGETSIDNARAAAVSVDAAALEQACNGFYRAAPSRSAKHVLHFAQMLALALLGYGAWAAFRADARNTLTILHDAAFALFAAIIVSRVLAASNLSRLSSRLAAPARWPIYTLLCPLYREAGVAPDLVAALGRIDYPGTE